MLSPVAVAPLLGGVSSALQRTENSVGPSGASSPCQVVAMVASTRRKFGLGVGRTASLYVGTVALLLALEHRSQNRLRFSTARGGRARSPEADPQKALGDSVNRILAIAEGGLNARARLNASGDNESGFLDPLREVLASGMTPADRLLERYHGEWQQDVSRVYEEESF